MRRDRTTCCCCSSSSGVLVRCWLACVWRLMLAVMITPVMGQASATATSSATFYSALTNRDVSLILIPPDNFQLLPQDWARFNRTNPYVLDRDLVIRSSAPPELGQMDFQFLMRKVLLAPNVTLKLEQLVLRNVNKLGGFGLDFFMGDTGSVIEASNSVRVKFVCPPPEQSIQAAQAFSAPIGYPPNEVSIIDGVCVLQNKSLRQDPSAQKCYNDAIHFSEFTLQVGSVDPDAGTSQPGYRMRMHNVTRVCDYYVSLECIQQASEDMCTAQLINQLLEGKPADTSWQPQTIAGVVVGGVVGFLAVCTLVGLLLWKHRHWWSGSNGNGNGSRDGSLDKEEASDGADHNPLVDNEGSRQLQQQLLPPGTGSSGRTPDPSQAVKLGQLLGSGSFGRVFKGRWHGMDVAVKIMDPCTPATLPRVLKEAEVMMNLTHPNVVQAYQCSVWSKKQQQQMLQAAEQRRAAEAVATGRRQRRQVAGGRLSSGSASVPSSSTASQAASSSSTAAGLYGAAAGPPGGSTDNVVVNIIPDIVPRGRPEDAAAAAAAGAGPGPASISTGTTSSSSNAVAPPFSTSPAHGATAASPAASARKMFACLWRLQQQEVPDYLQGPSTAGGSHEQHIRVPVTPLSSAAYTLAGSSSMGATTAGASAHTAAGVISSTYDPAPGAVAAGTLPSGATLSSSSTGQGTSGALSSQGCSASTGGQSSSGVAAAAGVGGPGAREIQPDPVGPVMGWLRRPSRRGKDAADTVPGSDSSSSKAGSPTEAEAGGPPAQLDRNTEADEMQVWLVLELCTGGSLKDAVTCGRIGNSTCQDMAKLLARLLDAANGLAYLHSQEVVHGDLKAANVLLQHTSQGSYTQVAKVSDFGVSAKLMDGATHRSTTSLGTITHMAPEVLRSGRLSKAADVYAYGIMMWEVFTNQTAHAGCHSGAVVERVVLRGDRPPIPANMPPQYALLMQRCWAENPTNRPTFEQVVACLELLLDNLTSSESEGRISEGIEEERTSSGNSDTGAAGKAAAEAALAAAAAMAAQVPADKASSLAATTPHALHEPAATGSSSGWGLFGSRRKASFDAPAAGLPPGKGLAESVESTSDWLSGPGTPGFNISVTHLQGLRQWYVANTANTPAVESEADIETGVQQPTPGHRTARLQPWLDQCIDAPSPPEQPLTSQGQQPEPRSWLQSRRWRFGGGDAGKAWHAVIRHGSAASSLDQAPATPHESAGRRQLARGAL